MGEQHAVRVRRRDIRRGGAGTRPWRMLRRRFRGEGQRQYALQPGRQLRLQQRLHDFRDVRADGIRMVSRERMGLGLVEREKHTQRICFRCRVQPCRRHEPADEYECMVQADRRRQDVAFARKNGRALPYRDFNWKDTLRTPRPRVSRCSAGELRICRCCRLLGLRGRRDIPGWMGS